MGEIQNWPVHFWKISSSKWLCVFFYSRSESTTLSVAPLTATHKALYGRDLLNDTNGSAYGTLLRSLSVITTAMGIGLWIYYKNRMPYGPHISTVIFPQHPVNHCSSLIGSKQCRILSHILRLWFWYRLKALCTRWYSFCWFDTWYATSNNSLLKPPSDGSLNPIHYLLLSLPLLMHT